MSAAEKVKAGAFGAAPQLRHVQVQPSRPGVPASETPLPFMLRAGNDYMAPTMNRGDIAFAVPADRYNFEGLYVLDMHGNGWLDIYRCEVRPGRKVRIWKDKPGVYEAQEIAREVFNEVVRGHIAAVGRVLAPTLLGEDFLSAAGPVQTVGVPDEESFEAKMLRGDPDLMRIHQILSDLGALKGKAWLRLGREIRSDANMAVAKMRFEQECAAIDAVRWRKARGADVWRSDVGGYAGWIRKDEAAWSYGITSHKRDALMGCAASLKDAKHLAVDLILASLLPIGPDGRQGLRQAGLGADLPERAARERSRVHRVSFWRGMLELATRNLSNAEYMCRFPVGVPVEVPEVGTFTNEVEVDTPRGRSAKRIGGAA